MIDQEIADRERDGSRQASIETRECGVATMVASHQVREISGEGRSARLGGTGGSGGGKRWKLVVRANPNDVDPEVVIGINLNLALRQEVANRAIIVRGREPVGAVAVRGENLVVVQTGHRVQGRTAKAHHAVGGDQPENQELGSTAIHKRFDSTSVRLSQSTAMSVNEYHGRINSKFIKCELGLKNPGLLSVTVKLSAVANSQIEVRLSFDSVDGACNTQEGWHVDDVTVRGSPIDPGFGLQGDGLTSGVAVLIGSLSIRPCFLARRPHR